MSSFIKVGVLVGVFFFSFVLCGPAHAILTFGKIETGFLLPGCIYNSVEDTTVGINVQPSGIGKTIYWSFFLADGTLGSNGTIPTILGRYDYSFSLNGGDAGKNFDHAGYLIVTLDDDGVLQPYENEKEIGDSIIIL